jgi:hypothetical protein
MTTKRKRTAKGGTLDETVVFNPFRDNLDPGMLSVCYLAFEKSDGFDTNPNDVPVQGGLHQARWATLDEVILIECSNRMVYAAKDLHKVRL